MSNKIYSYGSRTYPILAQEAGEELEKITNLYGKLTPGNLLDYAKNNVTPIREVITWGNEEAADKWRLHEGRLFISSINVKLEAIDNPTQAFVSVIVTSDDGNDRQYKAIEEVITVKSEIDFVISDCVSRLTTVQEKLKIYKKFETLMPEFDSLKLKLVEA